MKALLITLLIGITFGLCAVCAVQWKREADLHKQIEHITAQLVTETKLRGEAEDKAARFEQEITRLTNLRTESEAALLAAMQKVRELTATQAAREAELSALKNLAGEGADAIKKRNAEVAEQNAQLKKLTAERDSAINQLNARTREFNELVEKYNKLSKSVEAAR